MFWKMLFNRFFIVLITIFVSISSILMSFWWNFKISQIINIVSLGKTPTITIVYTSLIVMLISSVITYGLGILSRLDM